MKTLKEYVYWYSGPVYIYDKDTGGSKLLNKNWSGMTVATCEKKARKNLCNQFRQEENLEKSIPINLVYDICRKD